MIDADDVIAACIAYEQGFGHGLTRRSLKNPYRYGSDEWTAWDYGYSEGNRKKLQKLVMHK